MPGLYILCQHHAAPERANEPDDKQEGGQKRHPAFESGQGTQEFDPELQQAGKGGCQQNVLEGAQDGKDRLCQELALDDEQVAPFIQAVQEAKPGQPVETARQVQARARAGLQDDGKPQDEKDLTLHKVHQWAVEGKPFVQ
jgi:hypothetical protein